MKEDLEIKVYRNRLDFVISKTRENFRLLDSKFDKAIYSLLMPLLIPVNYLLSFIVIDYSKKKKGFTEYD